MTTAPVNKSKSSSNKLTRRQTELLQHTLDKLSNAPVDVSIALDRRVYFPGETVTGRVVLNVDSDTSTKQPKACRGVYCEFLGRSFTAFTERHVDYENATRSETVVCREQQTLLGAYYETSHVPLGVSSQAPTASQCRADYHVLCIPLRDEDVNTLHAQVVQCREHEPYRGKKILGEFAVNVQELLNGHHVYPISIAGQQTSVHLSAEYRSESLDDSSVGHLRLTVHNLNQLWTDYSANGSAYYLRFSKVQHKEQILPRPDHQHDASPADEVLTELAVGETSFPFAFGIPPDAPGSALWSLPQHASVLYWVHVLVDMKQTSQCLDPASLVVVTVLPHGPRPQPSLLMPHVQRQDDQVLYQCQAGGSRCLHWGRRDGLVSLKLELPRLAYAPGEALDLTQCQVVNDSSTPVPLRLVFYAWIERRPATRAMSPRMDKLDWTLLEAQIPPEQTVSVASLIQDGHDAVRIPAVFPSFDGGVPANNELRRSLSPAYESSPDEDDNGHGCLRWSYTLELSVGGTESDWATGVSCQTPLLICPTLQSPLPEKAVRMEESLPLMGPMDIFEYADDPPVDEHSVAREHAQGCAVTPDRSGVFYMYESSHDMKDLMEHSVQSQKVEAAELEQHFLYRPVVTSYDPAVAHDTASETHVTHEGSLAASEEEGEGKEVEVTLEQVTFQAAH